LDSYKPRIHENVHCKIKDANTGIAVLDTVPYTMKKTINGGTTWTNFTPTGYFISYPRLAFVPGTASMWIDVSAYPGSWVFLQYG